MYRETIARTAEAEARFERRAEEEAIFGQVRVRVAPSPRGSGVAATSEWRSDPPLPPVPPEYIQLALEGVREASQAGPLAGYPVEDIAITVLGGEVREGLAISVGYKVAASEAFRRACKEAGPLLLEPIMAVEVVVPEDFLGEVLGDLNQRRGRIEDVAFRGVKRVVRVKVPLRRMFGYSTELRSLSQGRATFTMQSPSDVADGAAARLKRPAATSRCFSRRRPLRAAIRASTATADGGLEVAHLGASREAERLGELAQARVPRGLGAAARPKRLHRQAHDARILHQLHRTPQQLFANAVDHRGEISHRAQGASRLTGTLLHPESGDTQLTA